jgi:hypothetical protein
MEKRNLDKEREEKHFELTSQQIKVLGGGGKIRGKSTQK